MKRLIALLISILCVPVAAQVSYSTITATVVDQSSNPLANANVVATLVNPAGIPVSSATTPNGQPYNGSPVRGTLDSTGHFSLGLVPNGTLRPANTQWLISITAPEDPAIVLFQQSWNVSYAMTVSGNQDISSQLSSLVTAPIAFFNTKTGQSTINGNGCPLTGCTFTGGVTAPTFNGALNGTATHASNLPADLASQSATSPAAATFTNLTASVNTQINVMMYGAKGDCSTDDTAAFTAAQTAAIAVAVGNALPATLYLPKPPGGCYIVSNMTWQGVSLEGQPSGLGPVSPQTYNVTLKSLPGQDILHIPDPGVTHGVVRVYPAWSIRNISFLTDNSVTTLYSNRYPGRWFDDGAMTSGSAQFTTVNGKITCGDVGQAIQVNGAGASGANLVTTIQSVSPCWQSPTTNAWQVVTLAAAASTTVTNAHTYVSLLGFPVTETIGNCAIAEDLSDGLSTNWGGGSLNTGSYGKIENVVFGNSGSNYGQNNCGIYIQGNPLLYGIDVRDFAFLGLRFNIIQGTTVANSYQQSSSGDFERWDHGAFLSVDYPWISYNGLSQRIQHVQLTGHAGFQVLQNANTAFDTAAGWVIDNSSFECPSGCTTYGSHITGQGHTLRMSFTSGLNTMVGYLDTFDAEVDGDVRYTQINGSGNQVYSSSAPTGMTENGLNNRISYGYSGNPTSGVPPNYKVASSFIKGDGAPVGPLHMTADAVRDGNPATLYNAGDLIITPRDLVFSSSTPWGSVVVADSTSSTGYYIVSTTATGFSQFSQFESQNVSGFGNIVVGTHIPATGATVYFSAKCPVGTSSFVLRSGAISGSEGYGGGNCTTSFQTYSLHVDFISSDVGKNFEFISNTNTEYIAWLAIVPDKGSYNGYVPQPQDGSVVLNPLNWTWSGGSNVADPGSPFGNAQSVTGTGQYVSSALGSSNLNGGSMFPAVPSKVTYWVGAPALFSTTLNGAITNAATSVTLAAATTSAWPSSGNIQIDNEVLGFSGVTAGLTTITVTRGTYGTTAQAHSNGANVYLIGTGQLGIQCNSTLQSVTDVYYAPTYTTFSSDFPAQKCSGYSTKVGYVQAKFGGTGQQYNVAQIRIAPSPSALSIPSAASQVPVSASASAFGNFWAYNSSKPLAGSGAGITTGPTSTIAGHVATFSGTTGQIQDGGALPTTPTGTSTLTVGTTAISANSCSAGATVTITGITTSSVLSITPASDISAVTGWSPAGSTLYFVTWPTANTFNYKVCNNSASSITPGASTTWNIGAIF